MTSRRSRSGNAWTDRNPRGDRRGREPRPPVGASPRSALVTTVPVVKQSWHGPSAACTWKSSRSRTSRVVAAMTLRRPRWSASSRPAADAVDSSTMRVVTIWRNSMMSNSSTSVSATSTKTSATRVVGIVVMD